MLLLLYTVRDGNYVHRLEVKLGWAEKPVAPDYWAVKGWENTLQQMGCKADVVFFGNSITYFGHFSQAMPTKNVVNLGYPGDNLDGMMRRIEAIKAVAPDSVFVMAGINGLNGMKLTDFSVKYRRLIDSIGKAVPFARIYLQSILPVGKDKEKSHGPNTKIREANRIIKDIARQSHSIYIDLYQLYEENGVLPDSLTLDGVHLCPAAYGRWYDVLRTGMEN